MIIHHEWTRRLSVMLVAIAELGLVIVGLAGRLSYTRPPQYQFLELVAGNDLWIPLHLFAFLMLATALLLHHQYLTWVSLNVATACLGGWSFFTLLWGLWPVGPVSLAAPMLGMPFAVLAHLMSRSYSETAEAQATEHRR